MIKHIKRGDIFLVDLEPVIGSEQGNIRPALIIQNDVGNIYSPTTIVASMTSYIHTKAKLPTHIIIPKRGRLKQDSIILLEQIRTIDKARLIEYIGTLSIFEMEMVDRSLALSVSLNKGKI